MTLRLTAILTLAMTGVMLADVYDHSGTNGDFADGKWFNQTTTPPGGPNVYGNPGSGDDAYFFGATITASGGGVHLLSGDKLQLSGTLTAVNVGILSLSGSGTLSVQAVVTDARLHWCDDNGRPFEGAKRERRGLGFGRWHGDGPDLHGAMRPLRHRQLAHDHWLGQLRPS